MSQQQNQGPTSTETSFSQSRAGGGDGNGDNPDVLIRMFMDAVWKLWLQLKTAFAFVMVELGGYQVIDAVVRWAVRNPHTAICLVAGMLVTLLPFLIILGFGLSTLIMTFTGFLLLEGVLLTIVAMLLLGCIGALVVVIYLIKQINQVR